MAEILWHRRETRRQTEKTNVSLQPRESSVYSTDVSCNKTEFYSTIDYGKKYALLGIIKRPQDVVVGLSSVQTQPT